MANVYARKYRNALANDTGARRRWRLLTEALKYVPLREALEIARAEEAFLRRKGDVAALSWHSPSSHRGQRDRAHGHPHGEGESEQLARARRRGMLRHLH